MFADTLLESATYNSIYGLNTEGLGYATIRMNEFDSLFTGSPAQHSESFSAEDYNKHRLKKDDILICRTNGNPDLIGKSALVAKDYPYVYESHLFKVRAKREVINSATLVMYLNTVYGRSEINRLSMQGNQANFSLAKFKEVRVPKLTPYFSENIERVVYQSFDSLEQSKSTYAQAEQILLEELGLEDFTPSNDPVNIKSFSDSFATSGRLDAEYYQKKYDDFKKSLESYSRGFTTIKDEYRHIKKACSRTLNEYHYTEISNINVGDGSFGKTIRQTDELPANAKICAQFGDLLISKVRPNRGAVSIVSYTGNDLIVSGAFTVLREKKDTHFKLRALQVLLRTKIYKDWLLQSNVGTQYPVITDDDVLSLTIPKIEDTTQQTIAALVENSFTLKHQSKHLLDVAKRAVEIAIEQNEGAATAYIDQHIK